MAQQHFLGVDWADGKHDICVLDRDGQKVLVRQVEESAEGFSEFGRILTEWADQGIELRAIIEKPEGRIIDFLLDQGVSVYPINPKSLKQARDLYRVSGAKSDLYDAWVLANLLRDHHRDLSVIQPNSEQVAELKIFTRDYHKLTVKKTRLVNQLKAELKAFYPRPMEIFEDLTTQTCLDFLKRFPTPEALERLTASGWRRFAKAHKMGEDRTQELWERVKAPQLPVRPHVVGAKSIQVQVITKELDVIVSAVSEYKRLIEDFFAATPAAELTKTLPGGKSGITIPTLWAELGDASGRWESFRHLQAHAGSTPITDQSGKHRQVLYRFACNKLMRYALHWLAQISLNESEWARDYYDCQRARGHTHSEALRALGAKWLKIIFVMWRDHVPYDENYHLANLYRQQRKQAVLT